MFERKTDSLRRIPLARETSGIVTQIAGSISVSDGIERVDELARD